MADSEISRSLCSVTRRTLLRIAAGPPSNPSGRSNRAADLADGTQGRADAALSLWRDWLSAHRKASFLGRRQQRLEIQLVDAVGFPTVGLSVPGRYEPVNVCAETEIDVWLGNGLETAQIREEAKAELSMRVRDWDEADERIGYSRALQAEGKAQMVEEGLLTALWETPAHSCAGVAGKLHAVLKSGEPGEESDEFPLPQIRSALADLLRIEGWAGDDRTA